jgi:hypothetical protein
MRSFKDIMSRVPLNVRLRFLESMAFANGKLVHVKLGDLRGVLGESDIEALMLNCGCKQGYACYDPLPDGCHQFEDHACNEANCKAAPKKPVALGTLLLQTPPRVRQHFLDSLDFENGQLKGAEIHLVEKYVDMSNNHAIPIPPTAKL